MDPLSALILAMLIATATMAAYGDVITQAAMGAWDHGRAQAAAELRRARQHVIDSTTGKLRDKLAEGKARGPASVWWWARAAGKGTRGLYRAMRGIRPGAKPRRMPAATPLRRIRDAVIAGAKLRAGQARARRARLRDRIRRNATAWKKAHRRPEGSDGEAPIGVCDRCGATCARAALEYGTMPGVPGRWLLCAHCRALPDMTPTETVPEPAARPEPAAPAELDPPSPLPAPAIPAGAQPIPIGDPSMAADLAIRRPGAPAHGRPGRAVTTAGDGQLTHGTWNRQQDAIAAAVEQLRMCQEGMLGNLRAVDAGRAQVTAIKNWSDQVTAYRKFLEDGQKEINRRLGPVVQAVTVAGGPDEVAMTAHYAEV